jgi:hypothetical protein
VQGRRKALYSFTKIKEEEKRTGRKKEVLQR